MRWLKWTGCGLAVLALLFAGAVFGFLGRVVDWFFWVFDGVLLAAVVAIACWWRRDRRRADEAARSADETELLTLDAIANHQPAPPRPHRFGAARWWRQAHRRASRIREGAR